MDDRYPWTIDDAPNPYFGDAWIQYHTLRWNGLVRGQLIAETAAAICAALNLANTDGRR